ncbi:MAG: shikimate kinase [Bacteroidia bacterium]|nr:shikimate kinase [Bacteroidia bacterium]
MPDSNRIYIIGFMGSGKSTAGKKLASLLGWSFIDLDKRIEKQAGKTIPEIFSQQGEDYFRNVEAEVLKNLMSQTNIVISTGGGTPCHGDNMDYMLKTGLTLYLKLTPGQLKSRLSESTGKRPLIKDLDEESLLGFIEEKLALREKWYNRAEITVEGINLDISLLYSLVKSSLNI